MNSERANLLVQGITSVAVIVGLALVIWELQQGREIAKLQSAHSGWSEFATSVRTMIGENGAKAWATACDRPDALSTEEMIVMQGMLTDILTRVRSTYARQQISSELNDYPWQEAAGNFGWLLSTEFGRWWWTNQQWVEPEIVQVGNIYLEQGKFQDCSQYLDLYRNRNEPAEASTSDNRGG